MNPDVTMKGAGYVASAFMADAGFLPGTERASGMNPAATTKGVRIVVSAFMADAGFLPGTERASGMNPAATMMGGGVVVPRRTRRISPSAGRGV